MQRWPWANWALIGLTVLVSCALMFGADEPTVSRVSLVRGDLTEFVDSLKLPAAVKTEIKTELGDLKFKAHQLMTHLFVHDGLIHLLGNMLFLFVFGNAVNAKIGHWAYLLLYLALGVVAGMAWYLFPGDGFMAVGASGAVMGVAGMFMALYPLNEISMFFLLVYRPYFFHLSGIWVLLGYFALDILGFLSPSSGVAHISHIAGFACGAGLTMAFILVGLVKPSAGEKTLPEVLGIRVKREDEPRRTRTLRTAGYTPAPPAGLKRIKVQATGPQPKRVVRAAPAADELPPIEIEPLGDREAEPQAPTELPPIELEGPDEDKPQIGL